MKSKLVVEVNTFGSCDVEILWMNDIAVCWDATGDIAGVSAPIHVDLNCEGVTGPPKLVDTSISSIVKVCESSKRAQDGFGSICSASAGIKTKPSMSEDTWGTSLLLFARS